MQDVRQQGVLSSLHSHPAGDTPETVCNASNARRGELVALREQRVNHPIQSRHADSDDLNGASPHRSGHYSGIHSEDRPRLTDEQRQQARRHTVQPQYGVEDDDALYETRSPNSARRYQVPATQGPQRVVRYHYQHVPPRQSRVQDRSPVQRQTQDRLRDPQPYPKRAVTHHQWHPLWYVGVTLFAVVIGITLLFAVGSWWRSYQEDQQYGRPRTSQCDAKVGHDDAHTPSHFIAVNLNKHIEVIELPGGDATKTKIYQGPTLIGDGQELTPITLEFRDVNGDGKPDMILHIGESRSVFINDTFNGMPQFRSAKSTDTVTL